MARPFLYFVWDSPEFDSVGPFESVTLRVPTLSDPLIKEDKKFYSLKRDFENLRKEGEAKGIVDKSVVSIGTSSEGREIWALKVGKGRRHNVIFTGAHHSREWIAVAVPYYVAEYLIRNYQDAPATEKERRIKNLVDNRAIWFIPMCNPDGHVHTITRDRWWRPNRRTVHMGPFTITRHFNKDGLLVPSAVPGGTDKTVEVKEGDYQGVDINRNYPTGQWGTETAKDFRIKTSKNPNDNGANSIWMGPGGASEPETKAISDLMAKEKFRCSITYHNFSQLILYPDQAKDDKFVQEVGLGLAELTNEFAETPYTYEAGSELYETTGDAMAFSYEKSPGRPSFTPELRPTQAAPREHFFSGLPEDQIEPCFNENLGAALALINCAGVNSAAKAGHGITVTGNLVQVAVNLNCWQVFKGWKP